MGGLIGDAGWLYLCLYLILPHSSGGIWVQNGRILWGYQALKKDGHNDLYLSKIRCITK